MKQLLKAWLPLAISLSLVFGCLYVVLQQAIRHSFDWPQIDAVNDVSYQLTHNHASSVQAIKKYSLNLPIDSTSELFVNIYDGTGKPVILGGQLGSNTISPPIGYLSSSDPMPSTHAQTWAPQPDVRIAAVVQRANVNATTYYIVAGRNLKLAEQLTSYLLFLLSLAWVVTMTISLLVQALLIAKHTRRRVWRGIGLTRAV